MEIYTSLRPMCLMSDYGALWVGSVAEDGRPPTAMDAKLPLSCVANCAAEVHRCECSAAWVGEDTSSDRPTGHGRAVWPTAPGS